jgi:hypothetical protein
MGTNSKNRIPKYVAYHEAGHIIAKWFTGDYFYKAIVRTREQIEKGPYTDSRRRKLDIQGIVDGGGQRFHYANADFLADNYRQLPEEFRRDLVNNAEIEMIHLISGPFAEMKFKRMNTALFPAFIINSELEQARNIEFLVWDDFQEYGHWDDFYNQWEGMEIVAGERIKRIFRIPGVWKATKELAETLITKRKITYKQTVKIIKKNTGISDRPFMRKFTLDIT